MSRPAIVTTISEVRSHIAQARAEGKTVGFVPTMGALHEGHLALMRRARAECGQVVVSIFVNPTQFPPGEDLERYPRDLAGDARHCGEVGVDLVFSPSVEEIYPPGDSTWVEVTGTLVEGMCAPHRPGHFRGVTTVCARLFSIVQPDRAYFGEKDYQQLRVITRMVQDLRLPLEVVPVATVRAPSGLALSSRNSYLRPDELQAATVLSRGLLRAKQAFDAGDRDTEVLVKLAADTINAESLARLQYLEARAADTLATITRADRPIVLAVAAFFGAARLIDNIVLGRLP